MQACFLYKRQNLLYPKYFFPFNSASFMTDFCMGNSYAVNTNSIPFKNSEILTL